MIVIVDDFFSFFCYGTVGGLGVRLSPGKGLVVCCNQKSVLSVQVADILD